MRRITRYVLYLTCCLVSTFAMAQNRKITGVITDVSGQPVSAASIYIKGTQQGVSADEKGNFSINAKAGDVLVISSVGFASYTVKIGSQSSISIKLVKAGSQLSEVVVTTALGIRRQSRELGYSTTSLRSAELNQAAVVNPATGLAAKVSGVDIRVADNGVNPQVKVTFRGSRSIEGNNAALVVVDGVPVDQTYLANINPTDIQDVTILKGSNAAALYGMAASNGVMIITTKKGKGKFSLTYANTVSFESISYFPALQNEYSGYGGESSGPQSNPPGPNSTIYYVDPFSGLPNTVPFENEDFGAPYNSLDFHVDSIPIGVNANGQWSFVPWKDVPNGRTDFFQTGVGDQNKLSGSLSNKWGSLFFSGEHTTKEGVVPMDTYTRNSGRLNGTLNFGKFSASGGISYGNTSTDIAGNSYDQYRPVYWNVMNQPPSTDLKSIQNISLFQYNQGFVNAYFPNPWWQIYNSRAKNSTDQLVSNLQLNYKFNSWISVTARGGYSRSSTDAPGFIDSIAYPSFLSQLSPGTYQWATYSYYPGPQGYQYEDIKDHYSDANVDAFLTITKDVNKFKFNFVAGGNYRTRSSYGYWYSNQINEGNVVGQNFIPNSATKVGDPSASSPEAAYATYNYTRNDQSAYGDLTIGYDRWLYLHGSFRNDWTSILDPTNRSFSYPSVDLSAVLSDKITKIKNSNTISFLKVRLGYAGTGNVSLDGYQELGVMGNIAAGRNGGGFSAAIPTYGAYAIYPITSVGIGYPYGTGANSYSQSNLAVQNNLQPEKTQSLETGFQLGLFKNRVNLEGTYYDQVSNNQTIPVQTSNASGISEYLTNAGKVNNNGVELDLSLNPLVRLGDFRFDVSTNFAYQNSKVVSVSGNSVELDQINYGTVVLGGIYAIAGKSYPQILTTDFNRDPKGRIIVDGTTGLPSVNPNPVDVGQSNYKYFVGLTPKFSYKNITLTAVFDYRAGAKILNEEGNAMDFAGISANDAQNRQPFIIPNSVINTGTSSNPNYVPNGNVPISSLEGGITTAYYWWTSVYGDIGRPYVTSADFIKLREIALSYEVPVKMLGSQKILKGLSLSVIGRNLFMWRPKTNIWTDPEFSTNATGNAVGYTTEFQTPPTRIISATISATIF